MQVPNSVITITTGTWKDRPSRLTATRARAWRWPYNMYIFGMLLTFTLNQSQYMFARVSLFVTFFGLN